MAKDSFKVSFGQGPYVKDSFKDWFGQGPYVKDFQKKLSRTKVFKRKNMREDQSTKHFFGGTFQNNRKMHLKVARSTKTVKNFRQAEKQTLKFKKLERERLVLSGLRIWGPHLQYSAWISYEEPLQTSCSGKL